MADIEVTLVTGYDIPQASSTNIGGIKADEKTDSETNEVKIDTETGKLYAAGGGGSYTLPVAQSNMLGGVKADEAQSTDTQPVRIGSDNKLYTAVGGGSYTLPTASETTKGGVKVGDGLEMTGEAIGLDAATQESLGLASTALQEVPNTYRTAAQQDAIHDSTKVDKESGKGLSANDYTTAEKTKLAGVAEGANNYTLPAASASALGGVKAATASDTSTMVEVKIDGTSQKLYAAATGIVQNDDNYLEMQGVDGEGGGVTDVKVNGTSVVTSGTASIPLAGNDGDITSGIAGNTVIGCVGLDYDSAGGLFITTLQGATVKGAIRIHKATANKISARTEDDYYDSGVSGVNNCWPIVPANLDYAVKAAMTDGIGSAWTDAQRLAALARLGCTVDSNGFVKWTAQS